MHNPATSVAGFFAQNHDNFCVFCLEKQMSIGILNNFAT